MTGSRERRAAQRAAWRQAVAAHHAKQRRERHRKKDPTQTASVILGTVRNSPANKDKQAGAEQALAEGEAEP